MSNDKITQERDLSTDNANTDPVLSPDFVLQNMIPVPFDGELLCPICAFYDQKECVPCFYVNQGNDSMENMYWLKTPNFDNKFFDILWKHTPETIHITMEQAMQKYVVSGKINELVSQHLTPQRCSNLYPECYSCDLGEHPDLCKTLGCSCRNPNGKDFVNIVWKKTPIFGSNNFLAVLGKYDKKTISAAVQLMLTKLIMRKKLKDLEKQSL